MVRAVRRGARPREPRDAETDEGRGEAVRAPGEIVRERRRRRRHEKNRHLERMFERVHRLQRRPRDADPGLGPERLRRPTPVRRRPPLLRLLRRRRLPESRRRQGGPRRHEELEGMLQARRPRHGLRRRLDEVVQGQRQGPPRQRHLRPHLRRRIRLHLQLDGQLRLDPGPRMVRPGRLQQRPELLLLPHVPSPLHRRRRRGRRHHGIPPGGKTPTIPLRLRPLDGSGLLRLREELHIPQSQRCRPPLPDGPARGDPRNGPPLHPQRRRLGGLKNRQTKTTLAASPAIHPPRDNLPTVSFLSFSRSRARLT
mmetsp:Transcript_7879/g.25873  ORF Transcript_7879/g.25873 Transcript_7879/m.25873 type:complete len:311 (-) Transcript_7879:43-975(-)